jgi:hypothetical protein
METRGRRPGEASPEHAPTGHFFDQLTQTLTFVPPSRQQALRLLEGGTLAAVLGSGVSVNEAEDRQELCG